MEPEHEHFVAVHGGAGIHSRNSDQAVKQALANACTQALLDLQAEGDLNAALNATERAICVLENDPCLNAGHGSNLTLEGTVECDAAIMDGQSGDFGSVGAVSGIANPIQLARLILEHSRIPDPLGRIPPMTLVSDGASFFASKGSGDRRPIPRVPPESLITPRTRRQWTEWKTCLDASKAQGHSTDQAVIPRLDDQMQDTVGAVVCDSLGRMASGVSSGGILLKHPGRIGEAAVYGAGCWASQTPRVHRATSVDRASVVYPIPERSMACSVSGAGEGIVKAMLARNIARALTFDRDEDSTQDTGVDIDVHQALWEVLAKQFCEASLARHESNLDVGVIVLLRECVSPTQFAVRLWCAFTTSSMAIAYASSRHPTPKTRILRRPKDASSDLPIYITAISLQ